MEIGYTVIVFHTVFPDFHGMAFFAVEGTVYKLYLGYFVIKEKLKLFFYPFYIKEA